MSDAGRSRGTGIGAKMAGGNAAIPRDRSGLYSTPDEVTKALVDEYDLGGKYILEPCAGEGKMASALLRYEPSMKVLCSDIAPETPLPGSPKIHKVDFFSMSTWPVGLYGLITNPPFPLTARMIEHAMSLQGGPPPFMALFTKATFWNAATRHGLFLKWRPYAFHPLLWRPDFANLGAPTMDCAWCVWIHGSSPVTAFEPLVRPKEF